MGAAHGSRFIDLTGQRFARLAVLRIDPSPHRSRSIFWVCRCECGAVKSINGEQLRSGGTKSCGCLVAELRKQGHHKDITGQKFARLTVLRIDPIRRWNKPVFWICLCECGTTASINGSSLRNGKTKSCGCLTHENVPPSRTTHGDTYSLEYKSWKSMIERCTNAKHVAYSNYGGRGITVCDRWRHSYENFLSDVGRRPFPKHSLDRIDSSKGYWPGNVRWATRKEQANNFRTNRRITYNSVTKTLSEWSGLTGIHRTTIWNRLNTGWTVGQALGFKLRIRSHGS